MHEYIMLCLNIAIRALYTLKGDVTKRKGALAR
jgi:hypothetical protein